MKRNIIITDLTRFADGSPNVCIAGIDPDTGECIRPLPYLLFSDCSRYEIFPGGVFSGDFAYIPDSPPPHTEDATIENLQFLGPCASDDFREVLNKTVSTSLEAGFQISLKTGEKIIPLAHPPQLSIITLKVDPHGIEITEDQLRPGKIKLNFSDGTNRYRFFPIADLGFYDFAQRHRKSGALKNLNIEISKQAQVYLRIGLSREYANPQGKEGYWLQVNGIYTFPKKLSYIRSYISDVKMHE